jgi:molecular chaperone DnaK
MALQRLKEAAEKAKMELSSTMSTDINLPFITADQSGPKHLNYSLTRAKFEQLVDDLIQRTLEPMKKALKDAALEPKDIDEVILVGGSTRIPKIQQIVKDFFGKEPNRSGESGRSRGDRRGHSGRGTHRRAEGRAAARRDPFVARHRDLGGVTTVLIRGTRRSRRRRRDFSTADDNQTTVEIHVLQGERELARDNRTIGKFQLTGIPPAPRGMPQIEVTFDIDANGILHVSAKDKATGKEQKIRIEASSGLSDSGHPDDGQRRREERDGRQEASRGDRHAQPSGQHDLRG